MRGRRPATWSLALCTLMLSTAMYAPQALGCWPYVIGDVECPDTGASINVPVRIAWDGIVRYTNTDELGHFAYCVGCADCYVNVTVGVTSRTLWVDGQTDFGMFVFDAEADGDDTTYCGCQPRVSGVIFCPNGQTLMDKTVTIYQEASESCPTRTYQTSSDYSGFFYKCVCDETWVTVSVDDDARRLFVDEHTDFGYFTSDMNVDNDPYTVCAGDCNDYNSRVYPGATEWCDGVDNDCDSIIDDNCIERNDKPSGSPVFRKPIPYDPPVPGS